MTSPTRAGPRKIGSCGSIRAMLTKALACMNCSRWTWCSGALRCKKENDRNGSDGKAAPRARRDRARSARPLFVLVLLRDHELCGVGLQRHVRARPSWSHPLLRRGAAVSAKYHHRRHVVDYASVRRLVERTVPARPEAGAR